MRRGLFGRLLRGLPHRGLLRQTLTLLTLELLLIASLLTLEGLLVARLLLEEIGFPLAGELELGAPLAPVCLDLREGRVVRLHVVAKEDGQVQTRIEISGIELEGLLVAGLGLIETSQATVGDAEVGVDGSVLRILVSRALQQVFGCLPVAIVESELRHVDHGGHQTGIQLESSGQLELGETRLVLRQVHPAQVAVDEGVLIRPIDEPQRALVDEQRHVDLALVEVDQAEVVVGVGVVGVPAEGLLRLLDRLIVAIHLAKHADHADHEVGFVGTVAQACAIVEERALVVPALLREGPQVQPGLREGRIELGGAQVLLPRPALLPQGLVSHAHVVGHFSRVG